MKNATRVFASTFGAIMALAGLEHGIGEILQGNTTASGIMIHSWPTSDFFRNLAGEPAMTLIPNMLLTGVLAVSVSLALLLWSSLFVHKKNGGWIMIGLSIALLLVGGGIFPPVFGIAIGAVANRINSPAKAHQTNGFQHFLIKLWPYSLAAGILVWLSVLPAGYFFGESNPEVILAVLFIAISSLVLTAVSGFAKDNQPQVRPG